MPAELEAAGRIFQAEERDGYRDRVVIGGLAGFVENLEQRLPRADVASIAKLLRDYASLAPAERAGRLAQAQRLLSEVSASRVPEARAAKPAPDRPAAAPARDRPAGAPATGAAARTAVASVREPTTPGLVRQQRGTPPPGIALETPIQQLHGVGPVRARLYHKLGLTTVRDLLFHFPLRHAAFPPAAPINELFFQHEGSVVGTLERVEVENLPRGLKRLRATVRDPTGTISAVWLRHGVARIGIEPGQSIALSGKLVQQGRQLCFEDPDYERADGPAIHTRGLVPVHPLTKGLTERELRARVHSALVAFAAVIEDPLPEEVRRERDVLGIEAALWQMHFPSTLAEYEAARRRFAFEELFTIQLLVVRRRMSAQQATATPLPPHRPALHALAESFPFQLTQAQRRVADEVLRDLAQPQPMTRLVQGEVGSGKTAVAALALLNTVANGLQAALMAPTEIRAEQHFATLRRVFVAGAQPLEEALGRTPSLALLTGSIKGKARDQVYAATAQGGLDVIVGTQALIQDKLEFGRLGLVIVDEQHRFGVRQRVELRQRANPEQQVPHLLVMTATPIPRTLALSLYGDLDLSTIDELPPGRTFPRTVLLGAADRALAYERVRRAVRAGQQAFIICPLVEESEALEAKAATEEYERLREGELQSVRVALLHGRMRPGEKDSVMRAFRDQQFDVLVSTAVVEVGVDIPNATVMLIEGAERFGLAQLHQFRGRVGRGDQPSVCILMTDLPDPQANDRLRAVAETTDGLRLAEEDLRLRGPGDFFGVRQSGLPELRVARLDDAPMLEAARSTAGAVLRADPDLQAPPHAALRTHLLAFAARALEPS